MGQHKLLELFVLVGVGQAKFRVLLSE
jgi:hypothetical protein